MRVLEQQRRAWMKGVLAFVLALSALLLAAAAAFAESQLPTTSPVPLQQYFSLEELGIMRESSDPDGLGVGDAASADPVPHQSFDVLGTPWMPAPRRFFSAAELPSVKAPWWRAVVGAAVLGIVLIPLLGALARFVSGKPIFGCEIKALAAKSCDDRLGPYGPGSYGRV